METKTETRAVCSNCGQWQDETTGDCYNECAKRGFSPKQSAPVFTIHARRWFDKAWGNTYHSVKVFKNEALIGTAPFEYGYDEQYLQTAHALLQAAGEYPTTGKMWASGADADYCEFKEDMRQNRSKFKVYVQDVTKKKDL